MNLTDQDLIRVTSAVGEIERKIKIISNIQTGFIYIPTAYNQNDARNLIQLTPLLEASSNGWDSCQVMVDRIDT